MTRRLVVLYSIMACLLIAVGMVQSWSLALSIFNLCLISAIMALGLNIQWGLAGQFNAGIMGSAALGGLAVVLISQPPVAATIEAGGLRILGAFACLGLSIAGSLWLWKAWCPQRKGPVKGILCALIGLFGFIVYRNLFDSAVADIEAIDAAATGYLGGLGLPVMLSWIVGGLFAALVAWGIGKISLGLRSDYFAIATFGIAEIIIYVLKNEDWLTRGVKNVSGLERPVSYEIDLQGAAFVQSFAHFSGHTVSDASIIAVKLAYAALFSSVLIALVWFLERTLRSPWGRMMRAIRDSEEAAEAMGKDVTARHLQVFVLGSTIVGIAGAMLVTLDGQFTPGTYQPLRFTFLIGVMAIIGGSGNNFGAVLGGFLIWFIWIEAEPVGRWLLEFTTSGLDDQNPLRQHLVSSAAHMRYLIMGLILISVLKFAPKGLLPEQNYSSAARF